MNIDEYMDNNFPWLKNLEPISKKIVETLHEKEKHYQGSWQKRGGPGAFMMLARKWDRIENIAKEDNFDIFNSLRTNRGDIIDDIDDLIGYLLLVRAKNELEPKLDFPKNTVPVQEFFQEYEQVRAQKIVQTLEQPPSEHLAPAPRRHKPLKG